MATSNIKLHKPPYVKEVLDDIEGGETNLLRASAAQADLKVWIPEWPIPNPGPNPDTVTLYWHGAQVAEKQWTGALDPDTLFLEVPQGLLGQGPHEIYYHLAVYNGAEDDSELYTLNIDTRPPVLNASQRLQFPPEIISNGVTAKYLEDNEDKVLAVIPDYDLIGPGDTLTWYWDRAVGDRDLAGFSTLTLNDMGKPLTIAFEGDIIRRRGDDDHYAYYQIEDRAGNASPDASPVTLKVAVAPIPRDYPWPDIHRASGSGELVTLVPEFAASGAKVIVPDITLIPGEVIWVQWAELGQPGAYRTSTPTLAGGREYLIPTEHVAPHIGKQISVRYDVVEPSSNAHPSQFRQLQVHPLNKDQLPMISCEGVTGGNLSLQGIPGSGAKLMLGSWPLIATSQRVRIVVTGVSTAGNAIEVVAVDNHHVTAEELTAGIGSSGDITAPRDFMAQLKLNTPFSMLVYVSFDEGVTWPTEGVPNFPRNGSVTLVA